MTEKQDPELCDDNCEGIGDESEYVGLTEIEHAEYDHSQFELPEDYEDEGDEDA